MPQSSDAASSTAAGSAQRCAVRMPTQARVSSHCLSSTCTPLSQVLPESTTMGAYCCPAALFCARSDQRGQVHTCCLSADQAMRWAQPHANSRGTGRYARGRRSQATPPMHSVSDTQRLRDDQNINTLAHPAVARHRAFVLGLHCGRARDLHHLACRHGHLRGARGAQKRSMPAQGLGGALPCADRVQEGPLSRSRLPCGGPGRAQEGQLQARA